MRIARGEAGAFEEVYDLYGTTLYRYALRRTRRVDLAEDALQEVMVRLVRNRHRLHDVTHLRAYLFTMTRNELIRTYAVEQRHDRQTCGADNGGIDEVREDAPDRYDGVDLVWRR